MQMEQNDWVKWYKTLACFSYAIWWEHTESHVGLNVKVDSILTYETQEIQLNLFN